MQQGDEWLIGKALPPLLLLPAALPMTQLAMIGY